jgi:hypothetical protein
MANVKQYLMNKFSSMLASIIQGSELFSTVIGDMGVLGHQIKIEARHQILHQMNLPTICVCRTHRLNSNRIWSSQLKQTIARFDEKLATILIKTSIGIDALVHVNYNIPTNGIHRTAFGNLRLRLGDRPAGSGQPRFLDRILAMKSESVSHHAATQALILSVAGMTAIVLIASLFLLILH